MPMPSQGTYRSGNSSATTGMRLRAAIFCGEAVERRQTCGLLRLTLEQPCLRESREEHLCRYGVRSCQTASLCAPSALGVYGRGTAEFARAVRAHTRPQVTPRAQDNDAAKALAPVTNRNGWCCRFGFHEITQRGQTHSD